MQVVIRRGKRSGCPRGFVLYLITVRFKAPWYCNMFLNKLTAFVHFFECPKKRTKEMHPAKSFTFAFASPWWEFRNSLRSNSRNSFPSHRAREGIFVREYTPPGGSTHWKTPRVRGFFGIRSAACLSGSKTREFRTSRKITSTRGKRLFMGVFLLFFLCTNKERTKQYS